MATLKDVTQRVRLVHRLEQRLSALEAEVQECRRLNLRLAELIDVVGELLVPIADRDEEGVAEALRRYRESVGGPAA